MESPDYLIGEIPSILHTVTGFTPCDLQGKSRIIWSFSGVSFENPPFEVESANLDRNTSRREGGHLVESHCQGNTQTWMSCMHWNLWVLYLYSEHAFSATEAKCLKSKQLRQLWESKLHALKKALEEGKLVDRATKFFVSLPTHKSHEKSHPTGIESGPAQKVHPLISNWRLGTRRFNWSTWSPESTKRVCKE